MEVLKNQHEDIIFQYKKEIMLNRIILNRFQNTENMYIRIATYMNDE